MPKVGLSYLGMLSSCDGGSVSTRRRLAYPVRVLVNFSIASKINHPRILHLGSPVIRHIRYKDSIVFEQFIFSVLTSEIYQTYLRPQEIPRFSNLIIAPFANAMRSFVFSIDDWFVVCKARDHTATAARFPFINGVHP